VGPGGGEPAREGGGLRLIKEALVQDERGEMRHKRSALGTTKSKRSVYTNGVQTLNVLGKYRKERGGRMRNKNHADGTRGLRETLI